MESQYATDDRIHADIQPGVHRDMAAIENRSGCLIFGFIVGSFILYADRGLNLGMPAEIVSLAQAICYLAFAGCVVYIIHR